MQRKAGNQQVRTKEILELAKRARPYYPEAIKQMKVYIKNVRQNCRQPYYAIDEMTNALRYCMEYHGVDIMAQSLKFVFENDFFYHDVQSMIRIGKAIKIGKEDLPIRTVHFLKDQKLHPSMDFSTFFDGIEHRGEEELSKGMDLAPYPLSTDLYIYPSVTKDDYDGHYQQRRRNYGLYTTYLGYDRLAYIHNLLFQENVGAWQIGSIISSVSTWYNNPEDQLGRIAMVKLAIKLIKEADLPVSGFIHSVFESILKRQGTSSEIRAILTLCKSYGVKELDFRNRELESALESYRLPGARKVVEEAAKEDQSFWILNFSKFGLGLGIGLAIACGDVEFDNIIDNRRRDTDDEAKTVTLEILDKHFPKIGIFGIEKEMIAELADNPLIVPEMWKKGATLTTRSHIVSQIEKTYGADKLRSLVKMTGESTEFEIALALQKIHPNILESLLANVSVGSRPAVVRSINWYGIQKTRQTIRLVADLDFDHQLILPIARGLSQKNSRIEWILPDNTFKVATKEHQIQYDVFLTSSFENKQVLGRAIRLYRRVYQTMWWRIITGHV